MHEIETKVLEVEGEDISKKIESLGAKKKEEILLKVDWFGPKGITHNGDDPWYLRVRSYSTGKIEITWKDESKLIGNLRKGSEINVLINDHEKMKMLFESIGLECYGHQEKKRVSWELGNTKFDLDTYPNMPSFLEIEVENEKDINEMIEKLNLNKNETWNDGERTLIKNKYGLNWFDMRF